MRAETRKQEMTLFDHRGELVSQATQIFAILCMSTTDQSDMNTGFQVTNKLYWVGKFARTESINNENELFYVLHAMWNIGYPTASKKQTASSQQLNI